MSKAFTRELDDVPERPMPKPSAAVSPGVKNYFTSRGAADFRAELQRLTTEPATPSNRQRLLDLQQALDSAVIVEPPPPLPWDQVLFGATVTVRNQRQELLTYRIVGVHETEADENNISWRSPVAKALLKARVGERIHLSIPEGEQEWEVVSVRY